jgi:NAD+ synthase (glutamine-hydrolysing)
MIWFLFVWCFYVAELEINSKSLNLDCRWECLKEILVGDWTDGILCSIGMPVIKGSERYNCQVLCFNRKIIMIRPKMWLANDGNYRELRWFTAWKHKDHLVDFQLPSEIAEAVLQQSVPFGYGYVRFLDT